MIAKELPTSVERVRRLRRRGAFLFVSGIGLLAAAFALFVIYLTSFSEGYEGAWDGVVFASAWLTLFAAVLAGLVSLLSFFAAERSA